MQKLEKKDTYIKEVKAAKKALSNEPVSFRDKLKESIFDDDEEVEEIYTPGAMSSEPEPVKEPIKEAPKEEELP